MTGFDAYNIFNSLVKHFRQEGFKYDYASVGPKVVPQFVFDTKVKEDDKNRFNRLAKKFPRQPELEDYLVANFVSADLSSKPWIGNFLNAGSVERYKKWQGRTAALKYNLLSQTKRLAEDNGSFNNLFLSEEGQHPEIYKALIRGDVSLETFILLDCCASVNKAIDRRLKDDKKWKATLKLMERYRPYLRSRFQFSVSDLKQSLQTAVEDLCL